MASYWKFYWPLGLMSLALQSGILFRNFILLGLPDGVRALAVFTLALSVVQPLMAALVFMSQLSTIMVNSRADLAACTRFLWIFLLALEAILVPLAWTPAGAAILPHLFSVGDQDVTTVLRYLTYFVPILILHGLAGFLGGLLVRARRTGLLTLTRMLNLGLLLGFLFVGTRLSDDPVIIIGWSWILADGLTVALAYILVRQGCPPLPAASTDGPPPLKTLFKFFYPMALTSIMFALNRPILFNIITRLNPDQDPAGVEVNALIAALSLAFSFGFIFQGLVNQYRHVGATFSKEDPDGSRRFLGQLVLAVSLLYGLALVTPFAGWFLEVVQGAGEPLVSMAILTILCLLPVPAVVGWRNFFHGLAMVHHRTFIMGVAALNRNLVTAIGGLAFLSAGQLTPTTVGLVMLGGFVAEALTVTPWRRWKTPGGRRAGPGRAGRAGTPP
jgi:hypothetical protein